MPPVPHTSDAAPRPSEERTSEPESEPLGATEEQTGDRTGPGAGYDQEPRQEKDKGGVTPS